LAACAEWAQAEYAWLYGLADASGCFELTNLRVIWGRVAAVRRNLTIERLEQIFDEFQDKGLLFVWEENGKRYGHWTGSDVPGRLPAPSWRARLERLAPPVPRGKLAEYVGRFSRGRAASAGGGFVLQDTTNSSGGLSGLKAGVEAAQAQDWNLGKNSEWDGNRGVALDPARSGDSIAERNHFSNSNSYLSNQNTKPVANPQSVLNSQPVCEAVADRNAAQPARAAAAAASAGTSPVRYIQNKADAVARELAVGQGPQCGPIRVRPEALARIRAREGSRSP
jgi:hypothetical protein